MKTIDNGFMKDRAIKKLNELIEKIRNDEYVIDDVAIYYRRMNTLITDNEYTYIHYNIAVYSKDKE